METTRYWLKSYPVDAVRLTSTNIRQIAEEIGAELWEAPEHQTVASRNMYPCLGIGGKAVAYVGDWVIQTLSLKHSFLSHETFLRKYQTHWEQTSEEEKYATVFQLVAAAMRKQESATHNGDGNGEMDLVAIETTKKILRQI